MSAITIRCQLLEAHVYNLSHARCRRLRCWLCPACAPRLCPRPPRPSSLTGTVQQPKPKRSSGGKGSAFTHAGTASGPRAGDGKDEPAAAATLVESRSSHDRLRDSESPCNNVAAPHKVRRRLRCGPALP